MTFLLVKRLFVSTDESGAITAANVCAVHGLQGTAMCIITHN